jgi:hypothetical protein
MCRKRLIKRGVRVAKWSTFLLPAPSRPALHLALGAATELLRLYEGQYGLLGAGIISVGQGERYGVVLYVQPDNALVRTAPSQVNGVPVTVSWLGKGRGNLSVSGI